MAGRKLTEQERRIWEAAARHVRRFEHAETPSAVVTDDLPKVEQRTKDKSGSQTTAKTPKGSEPTRTNQIKSRPQQPPTVQNRQNERRVRRGKQAISASFDLHGFTQDEAWRALPQFLLREQSRGSRCVIVITGKGRSGEGVLRRNFLHWIDTHEARRLVSGYAPAHQRHGGGGAWYLYLRKPKSET
ncbi:MAG: Smr/MutS family protein [Pseudomonadota bacterium]